jgi:hypothetical protein
MLIGTRHYSFILLSVYSNGCGFDPPTVFMPWTYIERVQPHLVDADFHMF